MLKKICNIKVNKYIAFIIIATFILMMPSFLVEFLYGHDNLFHYSHIKALVEYFNFGNFIPSKIEPMTANNFGYGIRLFYPTLPHVITGYFAFVLDIFKIDIVNALKIVPFFILGLSGITMFYTAKSLFKNEPLAFLSSIIYITFPYHFTEIYVRSALSEQFVFIFIPLIILGLSKLLEGDIKKFYQLFIPSFTLMCLSHIVVSLYFSILLIPFFIINYKKIFVKSKIIPLVKSGVLILVFILPFVIPMIEHKFGGSYVVFSENAMAKSSSVMYKALRVGDFLIPRGSIRDEEISFYFNPVVLLMFLIFILKYKEISKKVNNRMLTSILSFGILGIAISSFLFPWDKLSGFFLMIQFPWRLLIFVILSTSLLAPLTLLLVNKKYWNKIITCLCIFSIVFVLLLTSYRGITKSFNEPEVWKNEELVESEEMGAQDEYLPNKTLENIEYFNKRGEGIIIKDDNTGVKIEIIENKTPYMKINISNNTKTVIELPRLYYLGYELKLIGENKTEYINYYENENGFIEAELEGNGSLIINYKGTVLYRIFEYIRIVVVVTLIIYFIKKKF